MQCFISCKEFDKNRIVLLKFDNVETLIGNKIDEIIKELFGSSLQRYQEGLEDKMKESKFLFDKVELLYYKFSKITLNFVGSYGDSSKW